MEGGTCYGKFPKGCRLTTRKGAGTPQQAQEKKGFPTLQRLQKRNNILWKRERIGKGWTHFSPTERGDKSLILIGVPGEKDV